MAEYKLKDIQVDSLKLDGGNPRLPISMRNKSENEIINYLLANASVTELMESICENGFFPGEPLIAVANEDNKTYTVIEGNRRTTALKVLNNPSLAISQKNKVIEITSKTSCFKPNSVPVLISPEKSSISKYLGFRHITGVKSWKALEKARFLNHLKTELASESPDMSLKDLSKELASKIGSRSDYVRKILLSFEVYKIIEDNNFFDIPGLDDTSFYFTTLADSLSRESISKYLQIDQSAGENALEKISLKKLKKWCNWFFNGSSNSSNRINGTSTNLAMLARVLEDSEALAHFESGGSLAEANNLTIQSSEALLENIIKSKISLRKAKSLTSISNVNFDGVVEELREVMVICREIKMIAEKREEEDDF